MFEKDYNFIPTKAFNQYWSQSSFSYMAEPRPDFGILMVLKGQIDFVSPDSDTLCAKKNSIVFLPKTSYYEARFKTQKSEINNYLINFETDMDSGFSKPTLLCENTSFRCAELFRQFVEENHNTERLSLRSKGLFYLLLDAIVNENETNRTVTDKITEKAKLMLTEEEDLSISKIARSCSVSESGLRKIFKDKTGISPNRYRLNQKISKAKYLLESTDMTMGEISEKLNFYDSAYFCRLFIKYTGVSPKEYRKNKRL